MVVGLLQLDVHLPRAHSLKEKRSVLKSLRDQLRHRFNVAVAELEANELWQRATVGISSVADDRARVEEVLAHVTDWLRATTLIQLIQVQEEYF